jgi:hypothetical protein
MPAVPIPRKIQALIKMREQRGGGAGRVIQAGGGGCNMAGSQVVSTVRNLPKVYSPLYEFSNLMLPRDMKTMNAWNRQFFACVDDQTQTLTDNGWKYYWEIDSTKDKIGIFNPKTEELEFQFGEMFVYDYDSDADGPMFHFQTKKIDTMTTAQHRMWVDSLDWRDQSTWKNEWKIVEAQDVKQYQHRFRSVVRWSGNEPQEQYIDVAGEKVPVDQYLQYLGLFLSEGWVGFSEASTPAPSMVGIAQNEYRKKVRQSKFDVVATAVHCMPFAVSEVLERYHESNHDVDGKPGITSLNIYGKDFASHFLAYGRHSEDRFIPKWIKNLTTKYLQILLDSLICGDGTISYSDSYDRLGTNHVKQVVYSTASKRLADDVCEITLRCGYVPTLATHQSETTLMYLVKISDSEKGHYPVLKSNAKEFRGKEKQEVSYKGKVYCFHVPPHNLFVVRRNGKITITGNTNPIVRNAITLHATYPISKFNITCEDPKVKEFFEDMFDRMGFRGVLMGIALEFWKLGEAIPYLELDEENGVWDYAFLHNPDFIRVKTNALARYPAIYLVPDDSLRRLVQGRSSADAMMRQQLPAETAFHIMKGEDIPLPNFNVSHLKMMNSEYDVRGTSIITSCYKDLMLYDKLREMQFAQADGMINPLTLVKLGDPSGTWRPNDEDIRAFQQIMEESQYDPDFKIVTHGAVDIQRIGYSGATLDVSQMWDAINKNLYTGLLAPEAILNGEGANYSSASIGLEVLRTRYDRFREQLAQWVEKKVLEPICKLQDFYMTKGGVRKLIIPKVQWNRLNLRDMDSYTAAITGLLATPEAPGKVSDRVLFESLDLDYEEEKKCLRKEAIDRAAMAQELQALGKMSLEELQTLDPDKPIVDTHKGEAAPMSPEQMLGGPGGPGGPGGLPGGLGGKPPKGGLPGGGGIGKPPRAPVGEGGKPPAGGTPTAPTPGGAPTPVPGGPPPAAPKGPAPGA